MNSIKTIRLKSAWQIYPKGYVFGPEAFMLGNAARDLMVMGGQAEYVTSAMPAPANRMMAAPVKRGRGRPRKVQSA